MARNTSKPNINIPRADDNEVFTVPSGQFGYIKRKFEKIDQFLFGIITVVVLSMIAIIISVIGLFLDQMRFNNVAYKEYSDRTKSLELIQESNKLLLEQNKQNQQIILDQQKKVLDNFNK